MALQQAPAAGQPSGGGYLNLVGNSPIAPSAPSLIALKLLASTNEHAFKGLREDQTKWLASATALVREDPYLRISLGGDLLTASVAVADLLKKRAEEKNLQAHIDDVVDHMLKFENKVTYKDQLKATAANHVIQYDQEQIQFNNGQGAALFK